MLECFKAKEKMTGLMGRLMSFASLRYYQMTTDSSRTKLLSDIQDRITARNSDNNIDPAEAQAYNLLFDMQFLIRYTNFIVNQGRGIVTSLEHIKYYFLYKSPANNRLLVYNEKGKLKGRPDTNYADNYDKDKALGLLALEDKSVTYKIKSSVKYFLKFIQSNFLYSELISNTTF